MTEPISPLYVFLGDRDVLEHDAEVDRAIETINGKLGYLLKNKSDGVLCMLEDISHGALMEVVYKFRKAGWDVKYSTKSSDKDVNYLIVGIFVRI